MRNNHGSSVANKEFVIMDGGKREATGSEGCQMNPQATTINFVCGKSPHESLIENES